MDEDRLVQRIGYPESVVDREPGACRAGEPNPGKLGDLEGLGDLRVAGKTNVLDERDVTSQRLRFESAGTERSGDECTDGRCFFTVPDQSVGNASEHPVGGEPAAL